LQTFVEKYQAKYGSIPVSFAALGYDAVYIAKQAIEACGSVEYDAVVEALTTGTFSGLVTSSQPFTFNNGNPEKAAVVITFKDGKEVEAE
jgi:branched-chain amino acid transport system substrate-binding protein